MQLFFMDTSFKNIQETAETVCNIWLRGKLQMPDNTKLSSEYYVEYANFLRQRNV